MQFCVARGDEAPIAGEVRRRAERCGGRRHVRVRDHRWSQGWWTRTVRWDHYSEQKYILEVSTGPGRMRAGPGLTWAGRAGPNDFIIC